MISIFERKKWDGCRRGDLILIRWIFPRNG
jgi:hypothetical protein